MQSLEVISINIWQILISLCNLLILFFILKRFLYKPVKRLMRERQNDLEKQYADAEDALQKADESKRSWEEQLQGAEEQADRILKKATADADRRTEQIVADARSKAEDILQDAKAQAALAHKKAQAEIKKEIVDVSSVLTEKMLRREVNAEDHRALIDSVIAEIGEDNDTDQ